jgi:glucose-6-phosphate 1-epimerase
MTVMTMVEWGSLPALQLTAADGAQATITLFGAHLVAWRSADGKQRLFCSERSARDGSRAIRGGVPVIFPQFNERGTGLRHGFARVSNWRLAGSGSEDGAAFARFALAPADLDPAQAQAWPHAFALELRIALRAGELSMTLDVRNDGATGFSFSSALHTYHLVDRIDAVRIAGLQDDPLALGAQLDKIFYGVGGRIDLASGAGRVQLAQSGFTDAVVWNPGAAGAAAVVDLEDDDYLRFVCIEPAVIEAHTLAPGAGWRGHYRVLAA